MIVGLWGGGGECSARITSSHFSLGEGSAFFQFMGKKNYCAVLKRCIRCISYVTQSVIYAIRFGNINDETEVRKPSRKGGILNLEGDPTTGDLKDRSRDETRRMPLQE